MKQLYHGTKSGNMFGILSRGFLLPKFDELTQKYPHSLLFFVNLRFAFPFPPPPSPFSFFNPSSSCASLTYLTYGVQRTHASGMLGYGVYFANEFQVSHQYTSESASGSRFILVADVALGSVYESKYHNTDYLAPPSGYPYIYTYYLPVQFFLIIDIFCYPPYLPLTRQDMIVFEE